MLHLEGTNSTRNVQETRNRKNGKKKKLEARKSRWSDLSLPVYRFLFFVIFLSFYLSAVLEEEKYSLRCPFIWFTPQTAGEETDRLELWNKKSWTSSSRTAGVHLIDNKRPRKGGNCHQRRLNISPEHFTLRCSTNLIVFCFFQFGWLSAAIGFKCSHTSFFRDYSWLEVDYP